MIDLIKRTIKLYLSNAKITEMVVGTVIDGGIRIHHKLVLPDELIVGNLKKTLKTGDKVRLLRNTGGQQFYILEVVD